MTAHPRSVIALAVVAAALTISDVSAAVTDRTEEIANYNGADRQAVLEEGARKEGRFTVYTVGGESKPIFERFGQKYPFVRLELYQAHNVEITRRVIEEQKMGRFLADAIELNDGALGLIRDAGALQSYYTPEMPNFLPDAVEPGKHWISTYESYKGLGYNTKLTKPEEAPMEPDDLLDPKWKGKMTLAAPSMQTWVGGLIASKGEDFIRKLGSQNLIVYNMGARALANLVVSGEVQMSPVMFNSHMHVSASKGAPVAWRAIGAVYATVNGAAIAKHAPNPHASMLLVDFLLSKESQTMRINMGYASGRSDLDSPDKPKQVLYPSRLPDLDQQYEKWNRLGTQVFGKGKDHPSVKASGGE